LAFNIIWDICHEPEDLLTKDTSSRKSKQSIKENKKKEMTVIKSYLISFSIDFFLIFNDNLINC
jgi:hypothetical protein